MVVANNGHGLSIAQQSAWLAGHQAPDADAPRGLQAIGDRQQDCPIFTATEGVVDGGAGGDIDGVVEGIEVDSQTRASGQSGGVTPKAVRDVNRGDGEIGQAFQAMNG